MWESASATVVTPLDNEPANKAELYKDFNGGAKTSPAARFRFDKTPVEDKYTACANLFEQYGFVLENGGVAPEDVDAYIEEYQNALDEAGYQDVLAEFQKQYDAWK
jgi:putative aldouronate transport system substrate-binding protein